MERVYRFFGETEETRRIRKHKIENTPTTFSEPITICAVCLENIENLEVVQLQPCSHMVHRACMHAWTYRREGRGRVVNCPVCTVNITHITYIADRNSLNVTYTLGQYMNNYNNLMNMRFTARELFHAIPTGQQIRHVVGARMDYLNDNPEMILHDIWSIALCLYALYFIPNHLFSSLNQIYNSLNPNGGKSRKAKKAKKAKKTKKSRKRRKVRKH
jgi:hypothetical protein